MIAQNHGQVVDFVANGQDVRTVPAKEGERVGNGLLFTDIGGNDVDGAAVGISVDNVAEMGIDLFAGRQGIVRIV